MAADNTARAGSPPPDRRIPSPERTFVVVDDDMPTELRTLLAAHVLRARGDDHTSTARILANQLLPNLFVVEGSEADAEDAYKALRSFAQRRDATAAHADAVEHLPTVSPAVAQGLQVTENFTRDIIVEFGMDTAAESAERLGSKGGAAARSFMSSKRHRGEVLYLRRANAFVYPRFQFDATGGMKPAVAPLIKLARERDRAIERLPFWLCTPTGYLDGGRPVDVLDEPERVLEVAAQAWGDAW